MTYKFETKISETGLISLPFAHNLFNKQVEVIITPAEEKHRTTKERLIQFYGEKDAVIQVDDSNEIDWGKPLGEEVW